MQGEQARTEARDLRAHSKAALAALLHQLAGLATDIETFAASCVLAPPGLAMTLPASPAADSTARRTSKPRVSFSDLSDSRVVREGLESADGLGSLVAVSREGSRMGVSDLADLGDLAWEKLVECRRSLGCSGGQRYGGGAGGAGSVSPGEGAFEEMCCIIEDMCSGINQLGRERDEVTLAVVLFVVDATTCLAPQPPSGRASSTPLVSSPLRSELRCCTCFSTQAERLADVLGSQLRELRESREAQGNISRYGQLSQTAALRLGRSLAYTIAY